MLGDVKVLVDAIADHSADGHADRGYDRPRPDDERIARAFWGLPCGFERITSSEPHG
jgi:hypothetical protein